MRGREEEREGVGMKVVWWWDMAEGLEREEAWEGVYRRERERFLEECDTH